VWGNECPPRPRFPAAAEFRASENGAPPKSFTSSD